MRYIYTLITMILVSLPGMAQQAGKSIEEVSVDTATKGIASYYHEKFVGRKTSSGEIFSNDKFTAASNTLSLNTYVKVTNLANGKYIYVRINDRMAKSNRRLIDMAAICAKKLDYHEKGLAKVKVERVSEEEGASGILAQREAAALTDLDNKL